MRRFWSGRFSMLISSLLTAIVVFALFAFFFGCVVVRPILFPAPAMAPVPEAPDGSLIEIKSESSGGSAGRTVRGYLMRPRGQSDRLLLIFHGNGATMDGDVDLGMAFAGRGWNVLLVEYPGYGLSSDSSPSESKIYADAEALLLHMQRQLGIDAGRTAALGHSLGSAVAVEMAARGHVQRMALVSPFTSAPAVGAFHFMPPGFKWLPYLITCDRFNNLSKAKSIESPVLIVHGRNDTVVPFYMGEELHAAFPESVFLAVESDHNDVFFRMSDRQWQRLFIFLSF
ncbi:MAG: alpha/beta fold hydrolase [Leptonema illini]|uniref:Alpha/beta fold hydrolase n=1 Tax=Leptonema illini TaxID=183 RepID=A0A833GZV8_9LEPT|nr:MAG: alpha/beta fold hydrolase [Leptonema illini]